MEFEYWWLLAIPLFFGLGWAAARSDGRLASRESATVPHAYVRGLNFLLNEQFDKAIDAFVEMVRIEPEAIELHFALGGLFRRRGETDRAIRVHENLADRSDLSPEIRAHAQYELGLDFLKAGLIDRAEDAFNRLQGTDYAVAAASQRLVIAQMTHDWPRVIDLATPAGGKPDAEQARIIAQAQCELATAALAAGKLAEARVHAQRARDVAPDHPRPTILLGQIALQEGEAARAVDTWAPLAESAPDYVALVADRWLTAAETAGGPAGLRDAIARLQRVAGAVKSPDVLRAIAEAIVRLDGRAAAAQWVRQIVVGQPSLTGLQVLLDLSRADRPESQPATAAEQDEAALLTLVKRQADQSSRHVCRVCGFRARTYYWQCPGCSRWDTYSPVRSDD